VKIALDTNILAHAEGVCGPANRSTALNLLKRLPLRSRVVPVQVLGELYRVLAGKAKVPSSEARASVLKWRNSSPLAETTETVMLNALELATAHRLGIWDSVVIAASGAAGCQLLLSEDMQDGFSWSGLTVVNPMADTVHPLLVAVLGKCGAHE